MDIKWVNGRIVEVNGKPIADKYSALVGIICDCWDNNILIYKYYDLRDLTEGFMFTPDWVQTEMKKIGKSNFKVDMSYNLKDAYWKYLISDDPFLYHKVYRLQEEYKGEYEKPRF